MQCSVISSRECTSNGCNLSRRAFIVPTSPCWTTHLVFRPGYLFGGRAVAGLAVGALTHVVPMYLAEISTANIRGSLVALQQLSITLGVSLRIVPRTRAQKLSFPRPDPRELWVFREFYEPRSKSYECSSDWLAYGTSHIGGTRCAPGVPYTGPLLNGSPTFDPYTDVPVGGCTGQKQASWRVPIGFQMLPALVSVRSLGALSLLLTSFSTVPGYWDGVHALFTTLVDGTRA